MFGWLVAFGCFEFTEFVNSVVSFRCFICVLVVIRSVLRLFVGCLLCCFWCWAVMILMDMFMLNL